MISFLSSRRSILWSQNTAAFKEAFMLGLGIILLAVASRLSIPLWPVSLTFQSMTVVLIGMLYGSKRGIAIVATYLALGAMGVPDLADGAGGLVYFTHPSVGYLFGFLPAAFVSGWLSERQFARSKLACFAIALLGAAIIFTCGFAVLSFFYGIKQAIMFGLLPFIISEPIKMAAIAFVAPRFWRNS